MPKVKLFASKHTSKINKEKPGKRSLANEIQEEIKDGLEAHCIQKNLNREAQSLYSDQHHDDNDSDYSNETIQDDDELTSIEPPIHGDNEVSRKESEELQSPRRLTMIVESDESDVDQQDIDLKTHRRKKIEHDAKSKHRMFNSKTLDKTSKAAEFEHKNSL